jgi:hypothetical protein
MINYAGYKGLCGAPEGGLHGETVIWLETNTNIYAEEDLMADVLDTFILSNGNSVIGFENAVEWILSQQ